MRQHERVFRNIVSFHLGVLKCLQSLALKLVNMQVISLSALVVCFAFVKSTAYEDDGNDVAIVRGEKDRFTRKIACNESKAVCLNESCTYCQCTEGQTFAQSRGYYGECVSNELLVYATCKLPNQYSQ